ncbi:MAG: phenylalanine--tRNA ligase subunit beta, partial [Cyclobacteriaceae bacterium]|nr:phenylalanine--tRNA ligase subunit beta [Cyclobacteriaceae bacterium]
ITNFICHELGQPMHAFDADQITGGKVVVKTLPAGSKFTTLDGKERTLLPTDLMICNEQDGMCIAGVFGGTRSGITAQTTNVFLESACFSADFVRRTGMAHQLKTDASFRFERGTDPNGTVYALKRAALLILELAGGSIASELVDVCAKAIAARTITVKDRNVNRLIGKALSRQECHAILRRLDFEILEETADSYVVKVPGYRVEVLQEADVVEEILRIYGFNNIPLSMSVRTDYLAEFPAKDINKYRKAIGEMLAGNGFYEILTNSLTNVAYQQKAGLTFQGEPVEILNKLSEEQGVLRQTMLFTGLEVVAHNVNRKQKDLKLFEFGKIYWKDDRGYHEEERLALYMTGLTEAENWQRPAQNVRFADLAQQVSHVLARSGLQQVTQETVPHPLLEYGVQLLQGKRLIGALGKVKNELVRSVGLKQEVFFAELSADLLFNAASPKFVMREVPKFPEVRRDLSLVLDKSITFAQIQEMVKNTEKTLIRDVTAFDVYEGKNIPQDKKAYALAFTLQDEQKTLTDEQIENVMSRLMTAFEQKLGAVIRK